MFEGGRARYIDALYNQIWRRRWLLVLSLRRSGTDGWKASTYPQRYALNLASHSARMQVEIHIQAKHFSSRCPSSLTYPLNLYGDTFLHVHRRH